MAHLKEALRETGIAFAVVIAILAGIIQIPALKLAVSALLWTVGAIVSAWTHLAMTCSYSYNYILHSIISRMQHARFVAASTKEIMQCEGQRL
jgi:hypothetical protein